MRSGAASGHVGYFHETAFYDTEEQFLAIVAPFLLGGVAAGEPTLVTLNDANAALVRSAIGEPEGIRYVRSDARYQAPATAIRVYRDEFASHLAVGVNQIRVVGDVPHPGHGIPWDSWARYEAAINHAYNDFPVWGMCPYDTRITPSFVIDEVIRTHQHIATPDGAHTTNIAYTDPATFLASRAPRDTHDERAEPTIHLHNPAPRDARKAITALAARTQLDLVDIAGLELAVAEIVTNAIRYGIPPVTVQAWAHNPQRLVVSVSDNGPGLDDPFAGLLPTARDSVGGRGLWIAHQTCADVTFRHDQTGFTVTLIAGQLGG